MTQALKISGWLVLTAFAVFLFYTTTEYLSFRSDIHFLLVKTDVVFDVSWRTAFYIHIISAMIVLIIGPFQFIKQLRNKFLKWHRRMGKIYAYGIVALAGPSGFFMAFYAEGGLWSTIAFIVMSFLWIFTTIMAVVYARRKKIIEHKKWMIRSMALTFAAVTLRLLMPLFTDVLGLADEFSVITTAWLSWLVNLAIAETIILTTLNNKLTKELAV